MDTSQKCRSGVRAILPLIAIVAFTIPLAGCHGDQKSDEITAQPTSAHSGISQQAAAHPTGQRTAPEQRVPGQWK